MNYYYYKFRSHPERKSHAFGRLYSHTFLYYILFFTVVLSIFYSCVRRVYYRVCTLTLYTHIYRLRVYILFIHIFAQAIRLFIKNIGYTPIWLYIPNLKKNTCISRANNYIRRGRIMIAINIYIFYQNLNNLYAGGSSVETII